MPIWLKWPSDHVFKCFLTNSIFSVICVPSWANEAQVRNFQKWFFLTYYNSIEIEQCPCQVLSRKSKNKECHRHYLDLCPLYRWDKTLGYSILPSSKVKKKKKMEVRIRNNWVVVISYISSELCSQPFWIFGSYESSTTIFIVYLNFVTLKTYV